MRWSGSAGRIAWSTSTASWGRPAPTSRSDRGRPRRSGCPVGRDEGRLAAAENALGSLGLAVDQARRQLAEAEGESPGGEAELAEVARKLVALEEARVDARLRSRTLEGNLELIAREVELLEARMEEIRERMPMGQAPEEVPGGKAREREMRQLERQLEEIGPTNPLAESEHSELAARFATLDEQLADIEAARLDLEQLVARLREEEDSRYDTVFGAVAAGFQEYFAELTAGGKATLRPRPRRGRASERRRDPGPAAAQEAPEHHAAQLGRALADGAWPWSSRWRRSTRAHS